MRLVKRLLSITLTYVMAWLLATVVYGLFSLSLKALGITLQGPVPLSQVGNPIVFFTVFTLSAWLILKNRGSRQAIGSFRQFLPLAALLIVVHLILAMSTGIVRNLIPLTSSSGMLAFLMVEGPVPQMTYYRDIPLIFYVVALSVQELLFLGAALSGYRQGLKTARPDNPAALIDPESKSASGR